MDKTLTIIGLLIMMIEACMVEVKSKPEKNISWLAVTPNNPQRAKRQISFLAIFSRKKNEVIQNSKVALTALNKMNVNGGTYPPSITSLA